MKIKVAAGYLAFLAVLIGSCQKNTATSSSGSRSFYMGTTPWPANFTPADQDTAYQFINNHCDIVSHHFDDGIPYYEAFNNLSMPAAFLQDLQTRQSKTAVGKQILLSVAPLNGTRIAKAAYYAGDSISDSTKNYWLQLPMNDPRMVNAYVNYVGYLINQLNPQFVNYGVESNSSLWDSTQFSQYKDFLGQVYAQLKNKYPSLPFFLSFIVDETSLGYGYASELLPYTDYVALSAYPYVTVSSSANGNTNPSLFPAGYFEKWIALDNSKPFLFAETGYIAENVLIPSLSLNKTGTPAWQQAYLEMICNLCKSNHAKMLIWFCSKDYDAGDSTLRALGQYSDVFGIWQNIGFKDRTGAVRPSYQSWTKWMALPKVN